LTRQGQKQYVAARHEGVGQAVVLQLTADRDVVPGQGRDGQLTQHGHIHYLVGGNPELPRQTTSCLDLFPMTLAIVEGDGVHFIIEGLGLHQAGGTVLTTTEYHDGFFHVHHSTVSHWDNRW